MKVALAVLAVATIVFAKRTCETLTGKIGVALLVWVVLHGVLLLGIKCWEAFHPIYPAHTASTSPEKAAKGK